MSSISPPIRNIRDCPSRPSGEAAKFRMPTVSTREYQLDQSSPLPATAAADPVLDGKKDQRTLTGHYKSMSVLPAICILPIGYRRIADNTLTTSRCSPSGESSD